MSSFSIMSDAGNDETPSFRMHPRLQASLHFCQECNNLLYPKADPERRIMVYGCRICQYDEMVDNSCVYRNDLLTVTKCVSSALESFHPYVTIFREQVGVTTDLGADATLVRRAGFNSFKLSLLLIPYGQAHSNIPCPKCGNDECVWI